ncbi:MAG: F0F1 ATP synthase subunit delta [Rhodospirillaceae bacterium]|nr:MAG: F0F1 ATP synthase subunit delta [Rhodospirillaceae bacterium]
MAAEGGGVSGLAARYASALYELAEDQGAIDTVAADLGTLKTMIDGSDDFRRFIKSPVVSRADQSKGIAAVANAAQLSPLTQKFLGLVARNRRLFAMPGMIKGFLEILAQRRGQATADVVSAVPLSDAQVNAIAAALKSTAGRSVAVNTKIDPSILGGLIVRIGSRMVDSSLKSKLQRLKLAMKGVG